ncbi:hypothetical protein ACFWA9_07325 [Kitasatospora sp. NPDC059973]|uniref:hypothetical protein n=1 Tax=Kitasatospora sp. NPDC059973 TaxID=3347020 RepID=UPI003680C243
MTGTWGRPAADRVADLRANAERYGDHQTAELSDLDLLNEAYESVLREQIDARDRYMTVLTSLRGHDDAVRTAAVTSFRDGADRYAQHLVRQHMRPYAELAYRASQLPDRPGPRQMEGLRSVASRVEHQLADEEPPDKLIDPGDARYTLRKLRNVVGVLDGREGLDATDVLRLVTAALNDGSLRDLFTVAERGERPHEEAAAPEFVGPGWQSLHRTLWHYQPEPDQAHVKAFPLGGEWYLDLWSSDGSLLAWGAAPAGEVAALAPVLTARASGWAADRTDYAWRRFVDTAEELRACDPSAAPASGTGTASRASAARAAPARPGTVAVIAAARQTTPAVPTRLTR